MSLLSRRNLIMIGSFGVIGSAFTLFAHQLKAQAQCQPASSTNTTLNDTSAIINAVNGIAIFADLRDWKNCRQSFADQVEFDYTSLTGGKPSTITADQQMLQWSDFFKSTFKNTQHIIGSHVVTVNGNTTTCISNFQAHHTYLEEQKGTWILSGVYNHSLVRVGNAWKVNRMKMTIAWETGNRPS